MAAAHGSVPKEVIAIYNKALELSNRGDTASALKEYERAIAAYPRFIEAYNNIGEIYSRAGDSARAMEYYNRALKIERNARVLLNMGVEHFKMRDNENATALFVESAKLDPRLIEANFYAGLGYYTGHDFLHAEAYLIRVTAADRRHLKANYLLSHIYYEWKEYHKTIECLEQIWDIADDKSFINKYYGFCCYYLGRNEDAVKYLTAALKNRPDYAKYKKYLAEISYEKKVKEVGDLDRAIREMESTLMDRGLALSEVTRLSMLYIFKGDNGKAEALVQSYKNRLAS